MDIYEFLSGREPSLSMNIRLSSAGRTASIAIGTATLAAVAALFVRDARPRMFPGGAHDLLAAFSLAAIAIAYLGCQLARRAAPVQLAKAILVAAAFLFWAANQFWSALPQAALCNDIAIGLFVVDLFLVIAARPSGSDDAFGESGAEPCRE